MTGHAQRSSPSRFSMPSRWWTPGSRASRQKTPPSAVSQASMRARPRVGRRGAARRGPAPAAARPGAAAAGHGGDAIDAAVGTPLDDSPARVARTARARLRAHRREQDHLADRLRARDQHHQPVEADAQARRSAAARTRARGCSPRRRPRPPRRPPPWRRLGLEAGALVDRVVELGVGVGQLAPARRPPRSARPGRGRRGGCAPAARPRAGSRRRTSARSAWPRRSRRRPRTSAAPRPTPTRRAP